MSRAARISSISGAMLPDSLRTGTTSDASGTLMQQTIPDKGGPTGAGGPKCPSRHQEYSTQKTRAIRILYRRWRIRSSGYRLGDSRETPTPQTALSQGSRCCYDSSMKFPTDLHSRRILKQ